MSRLRLQLHEKLYLALAGALGAALAWQRGLAGITLMVAGATLAYIVVMRLSAPGSRARLLAMLVFTWVLYNGSTPVIDALQGPRHHATLLGWDRWFLGETPSIVWQGRLPSVVGDVLSVAYLSYQVYVHWAFVAGWFLAAELRSRFMQIIGVAFVVGFGCYVAFPALTPANAFPGLYEAPVPGGFLTRLNELLNAGMAARYDAFPSMHVLITAMLLTWDWRHERRRFWVMLGPAVLMTVGTLYLRLHYAVDLLGSLVLYLLLDGLFRGLSLYDASHGAGSSSSPPSPARA